MSSLQIHVDGSFDDTERRVLDVVARHESGEAVTEHLLTFENWQTFARVVTANRLELLRHVYRTPARSVLALARALGRDHKRVHEDVGALVAAGLLDRDNAGLKADYNNIQIAM